ncbi:MAG TPA: DUF1778 domain-containing protein [Conexibacter sp.]|nr:DUF1778 domain-containing protein [Conexibacter sp.]
MFDHVGIAVSDLAASERFCRTVLSVLGVEPGHADAELVEWEDWAIGPTDGEHSVTRGLHVGFRARDRALVDAFWQAGVDAGYRDDGTPGPRTHYGPTYYGGFLLDPDGNSVEAVHYDREHAVPDGRVDRTERISARVTSEQRARIARGAALAGQSISAFLRTAALEHAEHIISQRDLLAKIDAHLATATRHPAGTTDRLLAAGRERPY